MTFDLRGTCSFGKPLVTCGFVVLAHLRFQRFTVCGVDVE